MNAIDLLSRIIEKSRGVRMFQLCCIFICIIKVTTAKEDFKFEVIYWEAIPYIYKDNESGLMKGIFPEILQLSEFYCPQYFANYKSIAKYPLKVETMNDHHAILHANKLSYGQDLLENVTGGNVLWFPFMTIMNNTTVANLKRHNLTSKRLLLVDKLAVMVSSRTTSIEYKFMMGLSNCRTLIILLLALTILFAMLIWFFESFDNKVFSRMFCKGMGTSIWVTIVTASTVGYGDIVPRSFIARVLTSIWMLLGLIISAVLTATVTDAVSSTDSLSIYGRRIAVIDNSNEARLLNQSFNPTLVLSKSNMEAVDALRRNDVFAAVWNIDFASWYQEEIKGEDTSNPISFAFTIPVHIPVNLLANPTIQNLKLFECMEQYWEEIVAYTTGKFHHHIHIETLTYTSISMLLSRNIFVVSAVVFAVLLLIYGICYDLIRWVACKSMIDNGAGTNTGTNNVI